MRFLIILSSCQTLCGVYFKHTLYCVTCNDALKETDNKRALCASFPARYYRAQWSITCRDMAVHSSLTHGHNMKRGAAVLDSKTNFPWLYLRFSGRYRLLDSIVWSNWLRLWRKTADGLWCDFLNAQSIICTFCILVSSAIPKGEEHDEFYIERKTAL